MKRSFLLFLAWMIFAISFAQTATEGHVNFFKDQVATIILPTMPDADKGKYFRIDRWEEGKIIFEQEFQPQARTPYIIVPNKDFDIDLSTLDVTELRFDTARIEGVRFVGTYKWKDIGFKDDAYRYYLLDTTSDCYLDREQHILYVGAMRAYFEVHISLCYDRDVMKYWDKLEYVLHDTPTSLDKTALSSKTRRTIYDLQGRKLSGKPARGIYIEDGKKKLK